MHKDDDVAQKVIDACQPILFVFVADRQYGVVVFAAVGRGGREKPAHYPTASSGGLREVAVFAKELFKALCLKVVKGFLLIAVFVAGVRID